MPIGGEFTSHTVPRARLESWLRRLLDVLYAPGEADPDGVRVEIRSGVAYIQPADTPRPVDVEYNGTRTIVLTITVKGGARDTRIDLPPEGWPAIPGLHGEFEL